MYEQERCAPIEREIKKYNLSILGVSEMRWNTFGWLRTASGETILSESGNPKEDDSRVKGLARV